MKARRIVLIAIGIVLAGLLTFAKVNHVAPLSMVSADTFDTTDGVAMAGFDPVGYFTSRHAVKGLEQFKYSWKNMTWLFASQDNKNSFVKEPEKYAPQLGGYCSFAVSTGFSASANPENFIIHEGKLFLFNNKDVMAEAVQDGAAFWADALEQWEK